MPLNVYPETGRERDRWILSHRPERHAVDPRRPNAFLIEEERSESGDVVNVATIFLTNRECPWRCLMCDLWRHTVADTVPPGAIPAQIEFALSKLGLAAAVPASAQENGGNPALPGPAPSVPRAQQIKLYNSGSFFDRQAIPAADYEPIAARVCAFERVIVECHPSLINDSCLQFRDLLAKHAARLEPGGPGAARLEIAIGLETAHPAVLARLNKRMTLDQFSRAAEFLRRHEIALRAFILVKPPFLDEAEALYWAERSLDFAFECGGSVASLIPTRPGNGAIEILEKQGLFSRPKLATVEAALDYGLGLGQGRVFADLWDLDRLTECPRCHPAHAERLREMNLRQIRLPRIQCNRCNPKT